MKIAIADHPSGLGSATEHAGGPRGRGKSSLILGGERCLSAYRKWHETPRCLSASHRPKEISTKDDLSTSPIEHLSSQLRSAEIEQDIAGNGQSSLWIYIEGLLTWLITAPGVPLSASSSEIWSWRLQHYDTRSERVVGLMQVERLLPKYSEWIREAHINALQSLKQLMRTDPGKDLGVLITELEGEIRLAGSAAPVAPRPVQQIKCFSAKRRKPVFVNLVPPLRLAAESRGEPKVGEEHEGRFRVVFSPEDCDPKSLIEAELDLKRSMITFHQIPGQQPLRIIGALLEGKMSLPVVAQSAGDNPPELQAGAQLIGELERVVELG